MPAPIPDEARSSIVFLSALGYSQREVAAAVGVSRNTVRKYLRLTREVVEGADEPRQVVADVVKNEYDWERVDDAGAGGFGDLPM